MKTIGEYRLRKQKDNIYCRNPNQIDWKKVLKLCDESTHQEIKLCLACEKLTPTNREEVASQGVIRQVCRVCGETKEERDVS